jgi:hypothetical protein
MNTKSRSSSTYSRYDQPDEQRKFRYKMAASGLKPFPNQVLRLTLNPNRDFLNDEVQETK